MSDRSWFDANNAWRDKKIRYVDEGTGETNWIDEESFKRTVVPYRVEVTGTVVSWVHDGTLWLEIAGYGRVDAAKCEIVDE
jgi:hypothetical protein